MQKDYHYYAVYQLAKLAGFSPTDAGTIAYSSQYTDDSTESEPVKPFPDQHFDTVRTAHYNLEAFCWDVQKKIFMPFHFLPAKIRRESPSSFSYITQVATGNNGELATKLVKDALSEENATLRLIRLGVALHTVVDTFSHFGFSGRHHDENDVEGVQLEKSAVGCNSQTFKSYISRVADILFPRIGHVEALDFPDLPYMKWQYTDHGGNKNPRNNVGYSIMGAKLLYRFLKMAWSGSGSTVNLEKDHPKDFKEMKRLFEQNGDLEARCKKWKSYTSAPKYCRTKWRKDALKGDVAWDELSPSVLKTHLSKLEGKAGFDNSKWAYFHRAAARQRSLVVDWLN